LVSGSLLRRTKIIGTLGPASSSRKIIRSMLDAGMDVVRLNFSHGDHASHDLLIDHVRRISRDKGKPVPIIQDLQGPRFRVGNLRDGFTDLKRGMSIVLAGQGAGKDEIPIWPKFSFRGIKVGHRVTVGDLGVSLKVTSVARARLRCRVVKGGTIHSGKGVGFPQSKSHLPALTRKDLRDLGFGIKRGVDFVALSFVRDASDILKLRRKLGGASVGVVAKIETREAVRVIDDIIDVSDAILVARGDLASEVSLSRLPIIQKLLIEKCNRKAKPVITATQMLESMIANPQPTRAEASDVANAVLDGSDALMLSGETAVGRHPVRAVAMMASLIGRAEKAHADEWIRRRRPLQPEPYLDETIAYLAASAAQTLRAAAIITSTISGSTALRVAKFRPDVPIFAVTPHEGTMMRLGLSHGILGAKVVATKGTDEMIRAAIGAARDAGVVKKGDLVVITAGVPPWISGKTNLLKLEEV
jgi:pyruvate kinase